MAVAPADGVVQTPRSSRRVRAGAVHPPLRPRCSAARVPKRLTLPADAGMPLPDAAAVHDELTRTCRAARTLTAELALRGRAGDRASCAAGLVAGFQAPALDASRRRGAVRASGLHSGGVGAARGVVAAERGARAAWRRCGPCARCPHGRVARRGGPAGHRHRLRRAGTARHGGPPSWQRLGVDRSRGRGAVLYSRASPGAGNCARHGAMRGRWSTAWMGGYPRSVIAAIARSGGARGSHGHRATGSRPTSIIPAEAFTVDVPADAASVTLDELREAGPLREPAR